MSVFKEINKADGSGVTQFFRLSTEKQTVETNDYGDFYNFKGGVASRKDLPITELEIGDAYFIEDEEKTVFWDGIAWREINSYVLNYNYNDASNKPSINGHVLSGDKSAIELELQPAGDYLTEIPDEYITEDELEAKDYATEAFVIDQINNAEHFHREIVDALPLIGKDNVLYLVPKAGKDKDVYNEYIWTGVDYEFIGTTSADLSDYYKKGEIDDLLDYKVNKVNGKQLSTNDYTTTEKAKLASLENYDDSELRRDVMELKDFNTSVLERLRTLTTIPEENIEASLAELVGDISE